MKAKNTIQLLLNEKPCSYNQKPRHKEDFKRKIINCYQRKYSDTLPSSDLYGTIVYLYKENKNLDADNISKPIWDSLNGVAYDDDNQIKIRTAINIDISEEFIIFDMDGYIDTKIKIEILNSMLRNDHTLYIEAGTVTDFQNIFKISSLWE